MRDNEYVYPLAIIDCDITRVVGHYIAYHCTGNDAKEIMIAVLYQKGLKNISGTCMISDYGTHSICDVVGSFLSTMNISHEVNHTATTKENAHIKSSYLILES